MAEVIKVLNAINISNKYRQAINNIYKDKTKDLKLNNIKKY